MSTPRGLRTVALFEAAKGVLALLIGAGALALMSGDPRISGETLLRHWNADPAGRGALILVRVMDSASRWQPYWLLAGVLAYATLRFVEAYGLWSQRTWAEWLAIGSGTLYLPFEAWQLGAHFSWATLSIFGLNLAMVAYLIQGRKISRPP